MQQFFIESLKGLKLSKEQENQCTKVLRMRVGDRVRLVDFEGKGCIASFTSMNPVILQKEEMINFASGQKEITLVASLIRSERLEWMIQKACECGVNRIVLLQADHGVVRGFSDRTDRKLARLNTIALEASEQAYRQFPVEVIGVITKEALHEYQSDCNAFADLGPGPHLINAVNKNDQSITVVIGPEGGFSPSEVSFFNKHEFKQISLGKSVLRAETASIVACTLIRAKEEIDETT